MSPIGPEHVATVIVRNPIRLLARSEPQPDLVVARHRDDFYEAAHPTAEDTLLVIEVAESSLRLDRLVKLPGYAHQRIPEVWIVDVVARVVHVHADPVDGVYREVRTVGG